MERNPLAIALEKAWKGGIALQSQFFRENPRLVALAASLGLITTLDPLGNYGGIWRVTPEGCSHLFTLKESQDDEIIITPSIGVGTETTDTQVDCPTCSARVDSRFSYELSEESEDTSINT
jgi:hypothetical protein